MTGNLFTLCLELYVRNLQKFGRLM